MALKGGRVWQLPQLLGDTPKPGPSPALLETCAGLLTPMGLHRLYLKAEFPLPPSKEMGLDSTLGYQLTGVGPPQSLGAPLRGSLTEVSAFRISLFFNWVLLKEGTWF